MKRQFLNRLLSIAVVIMACLTAVAQDLNGAWKGSITAGPYTIPVVLNLQQQGDEITATLDSPEQKAYSILWLDNQWCIFWLESYS